MWWRKTEKPLRAQLLDAQSKLQRQIQIMSTGTIRGFGYQPGSKEGLQARLCEIDRALANLGPGNDHRVSKPSPRPGRKASP
jgi:hypothetical protein